MPTDSRPFYGEIAIFDITTSARRNERKLPTTLDRVSCDMHTEDDSASSVPMDVRRHSKKMVLCLALVACEPDGASKVSRQITGRAPESANQGLTVSGKRAEPARVKDAPILRAQTSIPPMPTHDAASRPAGRTLDASLCNTTRRVMSSNHRACKYRNPVCLCPFQH